MKEDILSTPKKSDDKVDIMGMLNKSVKKYQRKSSVTKSVSPEPKPEVPKTPGKKVDLNTLFNSQAGFTPIQPASPSISGIPPDVPNSPAIDFSKTVALRSIMGISQNSAPWDQAVDTSDRPMSSDSSEDRIISKKPFQPLRYEISVR